MTISLIFFMIGLIFGTLVGFAIGFNRLDNRKEKEEIPKSQYDMYYDFSDNKLDSPEELILFTELHAAEMYEALQKKLEK